MRHREERPSSISDDSRDRQSIREACVDLFDVDQYLFKAVPEICPSVAPTTLYYYVASCIYWRLTRVTFYCLIFYVM